MPKIYTKTGDRGETGLIGGSRVSKTDPRIAAVGDVDELNACLGLALSQLPPELKAEAAELARIQTELFELGAELASAGGKGKPVPPRILPTHIESLERSIDAFTAELPELKTFILPGGCPAGAALHVARAACRRAERSSWAARGTSGETEALRYLNRLSDYLFTLARRVNMKAGRAEIAWLPAA